MWWENDRTMKISLVAAIGANYEIGVKGQLLWHLPADMKRFKEITTHHHVLMGRKTFESIPEKFRPLPNRVNVILTSNKQFRAEGCKVVHSLADAIALSELANEKELMVIGGGEIYQLTLPVANTLYITLVQHSFPEADTFFPKWNEQDFVEVENFYFEQDDQHAYNYRFLKFERRFPK